MITENYAQQGWQCPICKRVYSPFTPCCFSCGAEGTTKTSTTGTGLPRSISDTIIIYPSGKEGYIKGDKE